MTAWVKKRCKQDDTKLQHVLRTFRTGLFVILHACREGSGLNRCEKKEGKDRPVNKNHRHTHLKHMVMRNKNETDATTRIVF